MMSNILRHAAVVTLLLFSGLLTMQAQTPLQKMNEVKVSSEYYWDEFTHTDADSAKTGALRRLLLYVDKSGERRLTVDDIMSATKFITIKRASQTRVFAYINKEEAGKTAPGKATQAPAKAETPGTPEAGKAPKASENPKSKKATKAKMTPEIQNAPEVIEAPEVPEKKASSIVLKIMQLGDFYDVYQYLDNSRKEGIIEAFGSLKDATDLSAAQLAIFSKETKKAVCVLSTAPNGETRRNLTTGEIDSLGNYENGGYIAIWFVEKN